MSNYYLGKIVKVENRVTYEIKVDIDGIAENKPAFPLRGEVDEPKVGDQVLLRNIDPLYGSVYLYSKLKEDEFIGFRSNGKTVEITQDYIEMRVYKFDEALDSQAAHDSWEQSNFISRVQIDKEGNIFIDTNPGNVTININGDVQSTVTGNVTSTVQGNVESTIEGNLTAKVNGDVQSEIGGKLDAKVGGNASIEVGGNTDLDSSGPCTITAPKTTLTGLKAVPGASGSLNCVPVCPFTGVKHYLDYGVK